MGYLLENPSKAGVFRDSLGFTPATLDPALRAHLIDDSGAATRPGPMVSGGKKFSVTGPARRAVRTAMDDHAAWVVDPNSTVRLITR